MAGDGPLTILVCALGGEGGGVLSQWLYETAVGCGHAAQATSIPGVAQRTGATTYYLEIDRQPAASRSGAHTVFCLNPVPGAIDLLVSSELLETVRQIGNGYASAERTAVISSTSRALTVAEKMQPGDGRGDDAALLAALREHARSADLLDMSALARANGCALSAVLLGAVAASGALPFPRAAFEDVIRAGGKGVESSLRGFAAAFDAIRRQHEHREAVLLVAEGLDVSPRPLDERLRRHFPAQVHRLLALGHARVAEYQDEAYAELYVERLQRVLDAERVHGGIDGWRISCEAARWLALWMAFDDIVRVAELKLAAERWTRVRREVAARDDEIVKLFDHFKPGVPEFGALLPMGIATRLTAWDTRRRARGSEPWALPLKLATHTVFGALTLRVLASLKGRRRRGSRFAAEQSLIDRWLAAVEYGARQHPSLGFEIVACGRLIKGYGATNERGKQKLLHVIDHLAVGGDDAVQRAHAVRAAREAALADDSGRALDDALLAHGAPALAIREQPIRWHRRPPRAASGAAAAHLPR